MNNVIFWRNNERCFEKSRKKLHFTFNLTISSALLPLFYVKYILKKKNAGLKLPL